MRSVALTAVLAAAGMLGLAGCGEAGTAAAGREESGGGRGAAVYASSCAACHGADVRGTGKGPSLRSIIYEPGHHSDESFRNAIINGARQHHWSFGDMPPVEGLSDEGVELVIAFVRAEQQRLGFED